MKRVNGTRISIRNVPTGKTGQPFQNFRSSREFSSGTSQKIVFHLHPNRNFREVLVNGVSSTCISEVSNSATHVTLHFSLTWHSLLLAAFPVHYFRDTRDLTFLTDLALASARRSTLARIQLNPLKTNPSCPYTARRWPTILDYFFASLEGMERSFLNYTESVFFSHTYILATYYSSFFGVLIF